MGKVGAKWAWLGNAKMAKGKLDFVDKSEIEVVKVPRAIKQKKEGGKAKELRMILKKVLGVKLANKKKGWRLRQFVGDGDS